MSDLDRQVAEALGYIIDNRSGVDFWIDPNKSQETDYEKFFAYRPISSVLMYQPSTNWQQCGELIERFGIEIHKDRVASESRGWFAAYYDNEGMPSETDYCKTPQEAVCRAVIALCKDGWE